MEIKHLVFGWTSFSSNPNKVGSPYTNISYANICNKKPTKYMKYTHFLFWGPLGVLCVACVAQWVACSSIASMVSPLPGQDQDCLWRRTPGRKPQLVGWFGCIDVFFCHRKSGSRDIMWHRSTVKTCNFIYIYTRRCMVDRDPRSTKSKTEAFRCDEIYLKLSPLPSNSGLHEG